MLLCDTNDNNQSVLPFNDGWIWLSGSKIKTNNDVKKIRRHLENSSHFEKFLLSTFVQGSSAVIALTIIYFGGFQLSIIFFRAYIANICVTKK
jgi:ABC-type glycerol-3-phosphate transport system permease component